MPGDAKPEITFEPLRRADFPLLARWLAEPLVARWWNHETTPEALESDFGPGIDREDSTEYFIVRCSSRRAGLIQRYRIDTEPEYVEELSAVCELPAAALGIDYLLGEPSVRGQGVGAEMIAVFCEGNWAVFPDSSDVMVPVATGNRASWRSLEKAGFELHAEGDLKPDNPIDPPDHRIYRLRKPGVS